MNCPNCGNKTRVVESRTDGKEVYRRRKCPKCNYVIYTEEIINEEVKSKIWQIIKDAKEIIT